MYTVLFLLSEILYSYSVYKILSALSGNCYFKKRKEISCYLLYGLLTGGVYLLWNIPLLTLAVNIILLIFLSMMYDTKISRRIFLIILIYVLIAGGETISVLIMQEQPAANAMESAILDSIFTVYFGRLVQIIIFEITVKILTKKQNEFNVIQLISFLFVSAGCVYLEIVLYNEMFQQKPVFVTITCVVILVTDVGVIWSYDMLSQQYKLSKINNILVLKNEAYLSEINILKTQETEVRKLKHDLKNNCIAIGELAKQNDSDNILRYLQDMLQNMEQKQMWLQTGNLIIDSFVNYKFSWAQSMGVKCYAQAKIPRNLDINEYVCAGIFGNLLDNAVEAASTVPEGEIHLKLTYEKDTLVLKIDNTCQKKIEKRNGKYITQKKDKKSHGYGLNSVIKSVEECNGQIKIENSENRFVVLLMIPVKKKDM